MLEKNVGEVLMSNDMNKLSELCPNITPETPCSNAYGLLQRIIKDFNKDAESISIKIKPHANRSV